MRKDLVIIPDDKPGVLARLGECLGEAGINIEACSAFTGVTRPDAGRVVYDGTDVTSMTPEARGRLGLIRSFQDAALFPTMTVLETVQLALERQVPTGFVASVLGAGRRDREPGFRSGGQHVRACMLESRADEVTCVLVVIDDDDAHAVERLTVMRGADGIDGR